jgi:hypothetical protein
MKFYMRVSDALATPRCLISFLRIAAPILDGSMVMLDHKCIVVCCLEGDCPVSGPDHGCDV